MFEIYYVVHTIDHQVEHVHWIKKFQQIIYGIYLLLMTLSAVAIYWLDGPILVLLFQNFMFKMSEGWVSFIHVFLFTGLFPS